VKSATRHRVASTARSLSVSTDTGARSARIRLTVRRPRARGGNPERLTAAGQQPLVSEIVPSALPAQLLVHERSHENLLVPSPDADAAIFLIVPHTLHDPQVGMDRKEVRLPDIRPHPPHFPALIELFRGRPVEFASFGGTPG
jgi:hypothetical protein